MLAFMLVMSLAGPVASARTGAEGASVRPHTAADGPLQVTSLLGTVHAVLIRPSGPTDPSSTELAPGVALRCSYDRATRSTGYLNVTVALSEGAAHAPLPEGGTCTVGGVEVHARIALDAAHAGLVALSWLTPRAVSADPIDSGATLRVRRPRPVTFPNTAGSYGRDHVAFAPGLAVSCDSEPGDEEIVATLVVGDAFVEGGALPASVHCRVGDALYAIGVSAR